MTENRRWTPEEKLLHATTGRKPADSIQPDHEPDTECEMRTCELNPYADCDACIPEKHDGI